MYGFPRKKANPCDSIIAIPTAYHDAGSCRANCQAEHRAG